MSKSKTSWKTLYQRTKNLDNGLYSYTVYTEHYFGFIKYSYTSNPTPKWFTLFKMKIHAVLIDWFIEPNTDYGVYFNMYKYTKTLKDR